jgi:hypothetical protein
MIEVSYQVLPDTSRVWIYQSSRDFTDQEVDRLHNQITDFTRQWVSHNQQLRAFGDVFHRRFIVLMVDESMAGASGCSIDSSVHFLKGLEQEYQTHLFDRLTFAYRKDDQVHFADQHEFARLYQQGQINDDTIVFDNLVNNKGDFQKAWEKPLKDSWHSRLVG